MSTATAIVGIALYYLSGKIPHVTIITLGVAGIGLLSFLIAVWIGASRPFLAAVAFQASVFLPLALGGMIAGYVIWFTASVLFLKGNSPSPRAEALATAVIAVLGVVSDTLKGMDKLRPSSLAAATIRWRYKKRFPKLRGNDPKEFRQAYEAIYNDPLSDKKGAIHGWGFRATCRRLTLIRRAL